MVPFLARFRAAYEQLTLPLGQYCAKWGIKADTLTYASLLCGALAGVLLVYSQWLWGIAALLLVGLADVLDGATARASGSANPYGMVLDHTIDRYVEFLVLLGVLLSGAVAPAWIVFTLFGMVMASYVRARAESTGRIASCNVGLAGRQEKLVLLVIGLVAQSVAPSLGLLQWAIISAGVISHITAVQRLAYTRRMIIGDAARRPLREDTLGV
ncbi:MAG: CDP-alcohol phosphatidyltransferase family protein [Chloroflexales bacterium]|nr:CDP-alcohol phosphatidyltransferase family protein [Chloroflexales bacterium]